MTRPHALVIARIAFAALALACAPVVARAAGQANMSTFIAVSPLYYDSSTYLDKSGQKQSSGCDFQKRGESLYVQQQLSTADQLRLNTEYDDVSCGGPSARGLNDIELDYVHGISGAAHPMQFALEGGVVVPPGYSIAVNPRLGLGRPGATLGALYAANFKAGSDYGYVTAGVNVLGYTGYPAPQLRTNLTVGLNLSSKLLVYEAFYGTTHLGAGGQLTNIGLNPTVNSSYDAYQIAENVAYSFTPHVALTASYTSLAGGWNTGIGSTIQAGLWLRF